MNGPEIKIYADNFMLMFYKYIPITKPLKKTFWNIMFSYT